MESTLSLKKEELTSQVGFHLGFGRGAVHGDPAYTDQQDADITAVINSGVRQFLFPPPIEGEEGAYDWSFLKPITTLVFPQGESVVPLPDDFGGPEGEITVLSTNSSVTWPIAFTSEGQIRLRYSQVPNSSGRPIMAALQPIKGTSALAGQRFQLYLFPLADQDYNLQFQYYVLPDALTNAFPYTYGGAAHAETILESCLSIAEQRLDDGMTVHTQKFKERLMASISLDRRNKPQNLGYNRDLSDRPGFNRRDMHYLDNPVRVYGAVPN